MKTYKFGIIGCGLMGRELASAVARWCHLLDMNIKPEITAVCDRVEPARAVGKNGPGHTNQHSPAIHGAV
mgnify:CR=1 FL=1